MAAYACLLLAQTLAGLALLGLVGGWVLWPFRTPSRPYLWLAAPLAGSAVLALALTVLYHTCGLSLPVCLAVAVPLNLSPTVVCLISGQREGGVIKGWKAALAVLLGVSAWCTWSSNQTAIRCGEPTVCMRDGSDTFGYAQVASWLLQHPQEQASWNPGKPNEAYVHVMEADPRSGAYLLVAAAACVRGTSALFSFDWLTGMVLAAGLLALVGGFASGRSSLLLLLAAGILSSWFTLSRSGYFGKILAYPGCILLAFVFWATWRQFSLKRLLAGALLGLGVGLCHSPATPVTILGLLLGGLGIALVPHWLLGSSVPSLLSARQLEWRQWGKGSLVFAAVVGPIVMLFFWWLCAMASAPPSLDLDKTRLLSFALDLDNPHVPFAGPRLGRWLICLALTLNAIGWVLAYRARNLEAASFLLCAGVLAVAWRGHHWGLSQLAGVLFPLSAIGVALLLETQRIQRSSAVLRGATLALGLAMIGLRVFQFDGSYQRYKIPVDSPYCFRQSNVEAIVRIIGERTVDVSVSDLYTSLLILTELGGRGLHLQIQPPVWSRILAYTQWPAPSFPRKGECTLRDGAEASYSAMVRFRAPQFQLLADDPAFARGEFSEENCENP